MFAEEKYGPDHALKSTPETVVWGYLSPDVQPVLRIKSGETVQIDTVNAPGVTAQNPESFFIANGIPITDSVKEIIEIFEKVKQEEGPHILTGPVYIDGAEPGDMLEVRIIDVQPRAPYYGVNIAKPGFGTLPEMVREPWSKVLPFDMIKNVAFFNNNIDIPLKPFMGIMGVAPSSRVPSGPPGAFGGNLDLKELTKGSTLFLPIQVTGGLFYTGDGHGAQGNGEVNITAIEASITGTFEFILHKGKAPKWPLAETSTHFIVMGLDRDLDEASRIAVQESIDFLSQRMDMTPMEAYSLASLAVDFEVTQLVDGVKGIHGMIPKSLFKDLNDSYWADKK
jgi:acetamidase/formamidase